MEQKLHTPEGVRDIYNRECAVKLALQKKLNTVLHLYGYQDIQTPTFEYFDVFRKEIGSTSIRDLYKSLTERGIFWRYVRISHRPLQEQWQHCLRQRIFRFVFAMQETHLSTFQLPWPPEREYAAWCRTDRCGLYRGRCRNACNGRGRT